MRIAEPRRRIHADIPQRLDHAQPRASDSESDFWCTLRPSATMSPPTFAGLGSRRILKHDLMSRRNGRIALKRRPWISLPRNTIGPSDEISRKQRHAQAWSCRTGFADHAERLALAHREADAIDRLDVVRRGAQQPTLDRNQTFRSRPTSRRRDFGPRRRRVGFGSAASKALYRDASAAVKTLSPPVPARRSCRRS